jgi:hypothetical protein
MIKAIYVLCPYGLITGGPDALHQLVYYINQVKPIAKLVYCDIRKRNLTIPKAYQIYVSSYDLVQDIPDNEETAVVAPETLVSYLSAYAKVHKYLWWLSIDNSQQGFLAKVHSHLAKLVSPVFYKKLFSGYYSLGKIRDQAKNKPFDLAKEPADIHHVCASYYAYDYVSRRTHCSCQLLIEPISLPFLKAGMDTHLMNRKRQVLYNPKKNPKFAKAIVKDNKDIRFVPLKGYSQSQLLELYRSSQLYMDFGPFPGAERIPKEAVYNGCLILTGKAGASAFHKDVPIPDGDKILGVKGNLPLIRKKLHYLLDYYDSEFANFDEYRETVNQLEASFTFNIKKMFLSEY